MDNRPRLLNVLLEIIESPDTVFFGFGLGLVNQGSTSSPSSVTPLEMVLTLPDGLRPRCTATQHSQHPQ
jgi:hypothetical protein